jgi:hypothetical protein
VEPSPIRAVARGLGPATLAVGVLAFAVARVEVARDEREFARLQEQAAASGSPGGLPARPTAAMMFWRIGNPDTQTGKDRARGREGDDADVSFQGRVRAAARALRAAGRENGHDVTPWLPTRTDMEAIASCTSTADAVCADVVEQLRRGCTQERVECVLPR